MPAGRFPDQVDQVLTGAGWFPGRDVSARYAEWIAKTDDALRAMPGERSVFPALRAALAEFGDLTVEQDAPGISLRRFDFTIGDIEAGANPRALTERAQIFGRFALPFGWTADMHSVLYMGEDGGVYEEHPAGGFFHLGDTLDEALIKLVLGIKAEEVDPAHLADTTADTTAGAEQESERDDVSPDFLPATSGALVVGDTVFAHTSIKGDGEPDLHPVIRDFFDALPTHLREPYIGRCAETVLVSDALWQMQQEWGGERMDDDWARESFRANAGAVTVTRIREAGDPTHGTFQPPCRACAAMLEYVGIEVVSS
ncbi:SUKH-3 domain-containing protein [Streptomyces sp. SID3343]|uniref:SUKH-3 domain-containing protein n=1 Tax=Streptomyces sp. SID3343 TaxID=2690260 RepID=UPI0013699BAD|nr:SUKH-3 domain-containing protein [Streptomyces sp. SID3343]MYW05671.1 hypothetical protein [Streptomyces sp. SID3343]